MVEKTSEKKVKTSSALWLGAANASTGLLVAFAEGAAFQYLFVNKLGLDVKLNVIVWLLFGIWNAINDPLYGFISDRTKSKLGRRIPWIRYGAPLMAIVYALMWLPSLQGAGVSQGLLFCQELLGLFLYDILYTAIASAIYVMPYEMAVTNKARNKIFLFNILFSLINFGAPMVLNSQLDKLIEYHSDIFPLIMALMGIVCGAIVFASTFFYKENGYTKTEKQPKFLDGLKMCVKNKAFLVFEVISWTVIFAQSALMVGLTYVSSMWADGSSIAASKGWIGGSSILILYLALALGLLIGVIFFASFREKIGLKIEMLILCGVMGSGCILGSFLGQYFYACVITFFCCGIGLAGGLYLIPMMNGDVIDKDEIDNNARREGVYAGINSLITKPAGSIANALFPLMLTGLFGFDKTIKKIEIDSITNKEIEVIDYAAQTLQTKEGLFICWFLITGILLLICFIVMWLYPLHGKKWNQDKEQLAKKHEEKEKEYEREILNEVN
ncbi:MAG: MFS transporter [Erysipelotrichaceae bacterium]|nr:MFS transporter [Erysipelotrichaceae bacterium]